MGEIKRKNKPFLQLIFTAKFGVTLLRVTLATLVISLAFNAYYSYTIYQNQSTIFSQISEQSNSFSSIQNQLLSLNRSVSEIQANITNISQKVSLLEETSSAKNIAFVDVQVIDNATGKPLEKMLLTLRLLTPYNVVDTMVVDQDLTNSQGRATLKAEPNTGYFLFVSHPDYPQRLETVTTAESLSATQITVKLQK